MSLVTPAPGAGTVLSGLPAFSSLLKTLTAGPPLWMESTEASVLLGGACQPADGTSQSAETWTIGAFLNRQECWVGQGRDCPQVVSGTQGHKEASVPGV